MSCALRPIHKWYPLRIAFPAAPSHQWRSLAMTLVCDTAQLERLRQVRGPQVTVHKTSSTDACVWCLPAST